MDDVLIHWTQDTLLTRAGLAGGLSGLGPTAKPTGMPSPADINTSNISSYSNGWRRRDLSLDVTEPYPVDRCSLSRMERASHIARLPLI